MFYYFWVWWKIKKVKIKILAKSELNNAKSISSKTIQECYISEKDYGFNNEEGDRCNNVKEGIRKKIKIQLTDFERKILIHYTYKKDVMYFINLYLIVQQYK